MTELPLFQLRNVRKRYGNTLAVDVESFDVEPGQIMCVLGPTGAGKSTLLRLLALVERPTTGEVFFEGASSLVHSLGVATRRSVVMVFQRPLLLTGTVRWNVEYGLRMRNGVDAAKVDGILERLGLAKLAQQAARTLSGGQTQLVALARALVLEPRVLLLDEPTANLDPAHVALVERVVAEEMQERHTSVIWATHNLFQARRVARMVVLILGGRLVEAGSAGSFFQSPSDPRTRDFVEGKMVY